MRELSLQLSLLLVVSPLDRAFCCRITTQTYEGCWFITHGLCIRNSSLNIFVVNVRSWAVWTLNVSWLKKAFSLSPWLTCPNRWNSKPTCLRNIIRLPTGSSRHRLHGGCLRDRAVFWYLLVRIVPTVSLTLCLGRTTKATHCSFYWLLLGSSWNLALRI